MQPMYHQIETCILPVNEENWDELLRRSIAQRPEFKIENGKIYAGQVVARFLGIPIDEDEYYNKLYDYVHSDDYLLTLLSGNTLNKIIDNRHFRSIQKLINMNREQNLSINRFVAFMDGEQLLIKSSKPAIHRKIREAMIATLNMFARNEQDGLMNNDLQRVLVDLVKWSFNHLEPELDKASPDQKMPKFLWYGPFNKSQSYFLYYAMKIGCDIIVFSPSGKDILSPFDPEEKETFVFHYPGQKEEEPFPEEKRTRKTTVAYRASREIETVLNHEGSGLYKPWQLRDYIPRSITLRTTYDELFLIMKEIAMIRPDFEVKNGMVFIPAIFAKIQGVSKNRKEYWDRLHSLIEGEQSILIKEFPFSRAINNDFRFHYQNALGKDGKLDPDRMMASHYWTYGRLPAGLQKGIAHAIRNICWKPGLKPMYRETMEDVKIYLFTQGMQIPPNILQLLQKFDYSQTVPKLVIFNNELSGTLTRSDAALLLLLNQFGIDIVIYNPAGHNDIENFVDEKWYDIHWLEDVVFEMEYKEPSLFRRFFRQGILRNLRGD